ncbi:hypothetical protein FRC02_000985 [Tulasnella sp. 418]|nr:hypothetical protein FRC02_000985 [Tulasnella sp. 418]
MSPLSLSSFDASPSRMGYTPSSRVVRDIAAIPEAGDRAPSSAEEGDESSFGHGSPRSTFEPDNRAASVQTNGDSGLWMFSEPYGRHSSMHSTTTATSGSERPQSYLPDLDSDLTADEGTPSLGDLDSAFAFFAAERAKLAAQLAAGAPSDAADSAHTPRSKRRSRRRRGKPGGKGKKAMDPMTSPYRQSSTSKLGLEPHFESDGDDDEEHDDQDDPSSKAGGETSTSMTSGISDQDNDMFTSRHGHRGIIPMSSVQHLSTSKSFTTPTRDTATTPSKKGRRPHLENTSSNPSSPNVPIEPATQVSRMRELAKRLIFHFPRDASTLRRVVKDPVTALAIKGRATVSDDALVAGGFYDPAQESSGSGNISSSSSSDEDGLVHVFVDHSNILVGFLEWMKRNNHSASSTPISSRSSQSPPSKIKLSHAGLALLLERGRKCSKKVLVASSPLWQSLDEIAGMGYQISVLQRVEIKEGPGMSGSSSGHHRRTSNNNNNTANGAEASSSTVTKYKSQNSSGDSDSLEGARNNNGRVESNIGASTGNRRPQGASTQRRTQHKRNAPSTDLILTPFTPVSVSEPHPLPSTSTTHHRSSGSNSRPRYREEAVDELLQLKLLQTLLDTPSPPPPGSTIILASGDAARSQFNPQGFLGCVRSALDRGWRVELVGWEEGRSRAWAELAEEYRSLAGSSEDKGSLSIIGLDKWGMDLLDTSA